MQILIGKRGGNKTMNNMQNTMPIIDTRGTSNAMKPIFIILGSIFCIIGFILCLLFPKDLMHSEMGFIIYLGSALAIMWGGGMLLIYALSWNGTHILVYADHIEGKGVYGKIGKHTKERFYAHYSKMGNITIGRYTIITVNIDGKSYQILTNKEKAEQVYSYCNQMRGYAYR